MEGVIYVLGHANDPYSGGRGNKEVRWIKTGEDDEAKEHILCITSVTRFSTIEAGATYGNPFVKENNTKIRPRRHVETKNACNAGRREVNRGERARGLQCFLYFLLAG